MTDIPAPTRRRLSPTLAIICLLVGLVAGAFAANAVNQRINATHAWTRGTMHLLAAHSGALGQSLRAGQCSNATAHLDRLAAITPEIPLAFGADAADPGFTDAASRLQQAVSDARTAAPADCDSLAKVMEPIGAACKNCHQQYR